MYLGKLVLNLKLHQVYLKLYTQEYGTCVKQICSWTSYKIGPKSKMLSDLEILKICAQDNFKVLNMNVTSVS